MRWPAPDQSEVSKANPTSAIAGEARKMMGIPIIVSDGIIDTAEMATVKVMSPHENQENGWVAENGLLWELCDMISEKYDQVEEIGIEDIDNVIWALRELGYVKVSE